MGLTRQILSKMAVNPSFTGKNDAICHGVLSRLGQSMSMYHFKMQLNSCWSNIIVDLEKNQFTQKTVPTMSKRTD